MVLDVKEDKKLQEWFACSDFGSATRASYAIYMQLFCDCAEKSPSELVLEANLETKKGLLLNERKSITYFAKFKGSLMEKNYAPKTIGVALSAVKSFYKFNDMLLSSAIGKNKARLPLRENQIFLTREEVKKLVDNVKPLRDRAIILLMASSGLSKNEVINLKIKDVVFDKSGVGIFSVRRQKVQFDYTTFCSPEAVAALKIYLEERNRTEEIKIKGDDDYVFVTYRDGFRGEKGKQLSPRVFTKIFKDLGEELGFQNGKGWIKSRSHALRKFFASTLLNAGLPKDKIDFMLGHVPSMVDRAYFENNIDALKELYIQHVKQLSFNVIPVLHSLSTEDTQKLEQLIEEKQALEIKLLELNQQILSRDQKLETLARQLENREKEEPFFEFLKRKFEREFQFSSVPAASKFSDAEAQEVLKKELKEKGLHDQAKALIPAKKTKK